MLTYKGYTGKIELDSENHIFHGEVLGITDVITFQGTTVDEIITAFHDSIDDYLAFCKERGEEPDKVYSGKVLVRMSPELHRTAAMRAELGGVSLNTWLVQCVTACLADPQVMRQGI
ncbi:MAG: type II toxin-antitoxin system HicB family antitoxin [Planctomycetota bacterium]|nr:type II toxin-antitoxin system HicB family antitoxin [Planctomycetota bacterium]